MESSGETAFSLTGVTLSPAKPRGGVRVEEYVALRILSWIFCRTVIVFRGTAHQFDPGDFRACATSWKPLVLMSVADVSSRIGLYHLVSKT